MDMNNEPVAWMNGLGRLEYEQGNGFEIPLYTHPAKESDSTKIASEKEFWECYSKVCSENHPAKTLTELSGVEIIGMSGKYDFNYEVDIIEFARAILRKAQEK